MFKDSNQAGAVIKMMCTAKSKLLHHNQNHAVNCRNTCSGLINDWSCLDAWYRENQRFGFELTKGSVLWMISYNLACYHSDYFLNNKIVLYVSPYYYFSTKRPRKILEYLSLHSVLKNDLPSKSLLQERWYRHEQKMVNVCVPSSVK